jgi:hypothetical protein
VTAWLDAAGVGRMIGHTARQVRERIALLLAAMWLDADAVGGMLSLS